MKQFSLVRPQRQKTLSGVEFGRVFPTDLEKLGITDPATFGEAWKDPTDMIWSDAARDAKGVLRRMTIAEAEKYCKSLGAELPSIEDYERIEKYMTTKLENSERYSAQVLPGLGELIEGHIPPFYWAKSTPVFSRFDGHYGGSIGVSGDQIAKGVGGNVRCVLAPRP